MSLSVITKTGDLQLINLQLQLSCKDASFDNLPVPFKPRPKLSRTPPNSTENELEIKNNHLTPHIYSDDGKSDTSVEYPPGSIRSTKILKKFRFKKSHRQRFSGTSSAKKTKEIRNNTELQNSKVNILLSCESTRSITSEISLINAANLNATKTTESSKESLPPSPPSEQLPLQMATSSNSDNFIVANKDSRCNQSPVSCSCVHQQCAALIHELERETSKCSGKTITTSIAPTVFVSAHTNFRPNRHKHSSTDLEIDPNQIRIALNEYEMRKGQNLEEIFRPQKTCKCVVL